MKRRFKNAVQRESYERSRRLSRDPTSELYWPDGRPHMTASPHRAYWLGRYGVGMTPERTSQNYACWAAGVDDSREFGPPSMPMPTHAPKGITS